MLIEKCLIIFSYTIKQAAAKVKRRSNHNAGTMSELFSTLHTLSAGADFLRPRAYEFRNANELGVSPQHDFQILHPSGRSFIYIGKRAADFPTHQN
jgi:hypothetical protein